MESYLPLELWILLADQRLPKKTLTTLCLTSKTLNEIFRPVLYREIVLPESADEDELQWKYRQLQAISQLPIETHLRHIRRLDLNYIESAILACLCTCFYYMKNLENCSISTIPDSAPYFRLNKIRDICLDLSKITSHVQGRYIRPDLPKFRNLHSLDLRSLRGNLKILGTSIARILFNDGMPTVTALGLDVDGLQGSNTTSNLFLDIFAEFDNLRREDEKPDLRLNLRDLILGKGMYHQSPAMDVQYDYKQWRLSKLLDVTKLRTLRLLNDPCTEGNYWVPYKSIHLELFDGITALQRVSVEFLSQEVLQLLHHLIMMKNSSNQTTLREFQATLDNTVHSQIPGSPSLSEVVALLLQFKWRQLLLSGDESCMDQIYEASWDEPSYQWEELGILWINWEQHRDTLLQLSKLRILMFSYATVTISGKRSQVITCIEDAFDLSKRIFTAFQERAANQKRNSNLRYIGIEGWVFTSLRLPFSGPNDERTGAEIVQLDKEEARAFDFMRMNEKLLGVKYRLGRR
ncbi:hypothetical protein BCIN_15g03100 [Botrytis cinerea B05.10]|uniref:Uncharacterized protein n=2 Tax=Botryotinia fuckeliana TaxID=40559 RepID=A0A384K4L7_BOTFB|nr:hypothetical protein BCIN_15g03100 [Botrytis cinerea B05.10]ATZ57775.1 hypothetical protein BCIN_15g03100 [Botrytis cinerea B05.10]